MWEVDEVGPGIRSDEHVKIKLQGAKTGIYVSKIQEN